MHASCGSIKRAATWVLCSGYLDPDDCVCTVKILYKINEFCEKGLDIACSRRGIALSDKWTALGKACATAKLLRKLADNACGIQNLLRNCKLGVRVDRAINFSWPEMQPTNVRLKPRDPEAVRLRLEQETGAARRQAAVHHAAATTEQVRITAPNTQAGGTQGKKSRAAVIVFAIAAVLGVLGVGGVGCLVCIGILANQNESQKVKPRTSASASASASPQPTSPTRLPTATPTTRPTMKK